MCYLQDSLEEQASQGSFATHGRQDVLIAAGGGGRGEVKGAEVDGASDPLALDLQVPLKVTEGSSRF